METISRTTDKQKENCVALRNDSGWDDPEPLIENVDAGTQFQAEEVGEIDFAFRWPSAQYDGIESDSTARCEDGGSLETHKNVATPSSLFGRAFKRTARASVADGCISPGTKTPTINPLSIPIDSEDAGAVLECISNDNKVEPLRKATPLRHIQPRRKSAATVGQIQKTSIATDSESSLEDVNTIICIEESQWHRNKPSRLLSYESNISTTSSEDFGENLTSHPDARSPEPESPDEWMMAEESCNTPPPPSGMSPTGSRKSFKFVKKPKLRTRKRRSSPHKAQRQSKDSLKSTNTGGSLDEARSLSAAQPSRHYSYGATLDLPPIGIQTSRDLSNYKVSQTEALLDATPAIPVPTLRELEAQMDHTDETSPLLRRRIIGSLLVLTNAIFVGSTLFFFLRPKIWNESRYAVSSSYSVTNWRTEMLICWCR